MNISLNWIKEYTDVNLDFEELISRVRSQIGEVETYTNFEEKYKDILVARISEKQDHPNADKLAVYQIDIGSDKFIQVVAGDKTLEVGDLVAYFKPGAKVPFNNYPEKSDGIIKETDLRGVISYGMLASEKELDLGSDHSLVMRLEKSLKPGEKFADVMNFNDMVFDIENKALANRADCFGILGIAREIAGLQGIKFSSPEWYISANNENFTNSESTLPLKVNNNGGNLCSRYMAIAMSNITIEDSPIWLKSILLKSGVRPINNIVDITNYMMLLTGIPLHAFDYDKVKLKDPSQSSDATITVRIGKNGEKITTLDKKTHEVDDTMLLICDSTNPIAIAGIMGGSETEIDENSKNIIIECANFDKYNIRKTSMKLGIFTEAVTRFTKGQDPQKCEQVLAKTVSLISEIGNGIVASELIDSYPHPSSKIDVEVSIEKLNAHLGTQFTAEQISTILDNVELYNRPLKEGWLSVDIPSYRADITIKEDIHEEVGRLYGYNKIPQTLPERSIKPTGVNKKVALQKKIRQIMISSGATEILTYNFTGKDSFKKYNQKIENAFHLKNSLSPDLEYMRTAILPSVLDKILPNIRDGYKEVALFEINKSHNKSENNDENLPLERTSLAFGIGVEDKKAVDSYSGSPFFTAKVYLQQLLQKLNYTDVQYQLLADIDREALPFWIGNIIGMFNTNQSAVVYINIESTLIPIGVVGVLTENVIKNVKLPRFSAGFEVSIDELLKIYQSKIHYVEPSKYPKVMNDLCFIFDQKITYSEVKEAIEKELEQRSVNVDVSPIDIYQSEVQQSEGKKQITYRITLQSKDQTLTNDNVTLLLKEVTQKITKVFGAVIVA